MFSCDRCSALCASRTQIVLPDASDTLRHLPLLVIGEAPGADEDAQGRGFVGRAGRTLHRLLESFGLVRWHQYGCANIVRCRPEGNRRPTAEEIWNCGAFLLETLERSKPEAILLVGGTATSVFCGSGPLHMRMAELRRSDHHLNLDLCHPRLKPFFEQKAVRVFAIPHTSPLSWNRNAPDGRKWSEWAKEEVRALSSLFAKR